ncbi:DUF4367 domain-containing protein [Bacillus horti]|uniref:DUF4367 domain-containing protein n=2 Tax=Caldalkalibacillus horti TaxID=77523 RepID=A0ABT9W459_9BACI|nr:DUF4367 domain-containing protein [Bacillus horti]MDQ0168023.1 hypothetical protein [Bacillus horti]
MSDEFKHNDEELKSWLNSVHKDVDIPDNQKPWPNVKERLDKIKKRNRRIKRIKIITAIACMSLLISFALTADLPTAYSQFQGLVKKVQENIIDIFFDEEQQNIENIGAKTLPPPPNIESTPTDGLRSEDTSLEKAQQMLSFNLVVPTYIPDEYSLDLVRIYQDTDGEYRTAFIEYVNDDGRIIQLSQRMLSENSTPETARFYENATIHDLQINENKAVMIVYDNNFVQIDWLTDDQIKFSLFGLLSESEILSIAESLY